MDLAELINLIKNKEELRGISSSLVLETLNKSLSKLKADISNLNKQDTKLIVKMVRAELRRYVGQFQISAKKKEKMLREEDFDSILKVHSSTKERIVFYSEIKKIISDLSPKTILDLGCGINPVVLANDKINYYACDINESDLDIVRRYFEKNKIQGNVFIYDLRNFSNDLPESDLCLMFKILDTIEKKGHKIAESLISQLKCNYILISFSTNKLSGKKMNFPKRLWLERLLKRLRYNYTIFNSANEVFYLVDKN